MQRPELHLLIAAIFQRFSNGVNPVIYVFSMSDRQCLLKGLAIIVINDGIFNFPSDSINVLITERLPASFPTRQLFPLLYKAVGRKEKVVIFANKFVNPIVV